MWRTNPQADVTHLSVGCIPAAEARVYSFAPQWPDANAECRHLGSRRAVESIVRSGPSCDDGEEIGDAKTPPGPAYEIAQVLANKTPRLARS